MMNNREANFDCRQSQFELMRIVAMLLVLVVHADFYSIGDPVLSDVIEFPISSFSKITVESFALVCVNVFVIISGYFGIKVTKRHVANFLFMVMFWRVLIIAVILGGSFQTIPQKELIMLFVPAYEDWFVASYLILLLLAPVLNSFIACRSAKELWIYCAVYALFQWLLAWPTCAITQFGGGYSALSFVGLYILGAAIHRSSSGIQKIIRYPFTIYVLICLSAAIFVFGIGYLTKYESLYNRINDMFGAYNSINVLVASAFFFLVFGRMNFSNLFINRIATSAFAVYLFHMHPLMREYYRDVCRYLYYSYPTGIYLCLIFAFIISVFVGAVLVDRIRIWLWKVLISCFNPRPTAESK